MPGKFWLLPALFLTWLVLTWLVLMLATKAAMAAGSDAFALVSRAMQAKSTATYQGRQTITWSLPPAQGGGMMEIVTADTHRGLQSRIAYLFPPPVAGRVMTDDGRQTSLYEPQRGYLLVQPSVARTAAADRQTMLGLLRRNYTCVVVRRERINGRACAVVAIRPRTEDGAFKLCWIDQARPFVLRLEEYDGQGCRRYVSAYDSISFVRSLPARTLTLPPAAQSAPRRVVRAETMSALSLPAAWKQAGFAGRTPAWMPPGFALLRLSRLTPPAGEPPLVQMSCSDGLQTLTVTESKPSGPAPDAAMLSSALARYGQQAWLAECRSARILVRGSLSLPPEVGAEMARALAPGTERRLARAFVHQFGAADGKELGPLRGAGWDYVEMASAALFLQRHPQKRLVFQVLLGKKGLGIGTWPAAARVLHADYPALDTQARAWVMSASRPGSLAWEQGK